MAACERRETHTRSSGEVKGSGKWGGCALAHCMCSIWAPARLTRPREGTFTKKVHNCPSQGGRGDCDGRVDEYAYLIIPVQPKFTQQRLVLTIDVGHALERRHDQHGEAGQHVVGKCGEGWPCTDSAASKAAPEVQATRGIGLPTLSSAAARKAARGPFAIVVGFLLYGSGVYVRLGCGE